MVILCFLIKKNNHIRWLQDHIVVNNKEMLMIIPRKKLNQFKIKRDFN